MKLVNSINDLLSITNIKQKNGFEKTIRFSKPIFGGLIG